MYAGVNGNQTTQGNPPEAQGVAARRRRLLAQHQHGAARRLRRLLGAVQLPGAEHVDQQLRPGRLHAEHARCQQTAGTPTVTLDNPFPNGVLQPSGNSKGLLSGLGGDASFVDQNRSAPRVQQWSADLQRELGNGMALTFTYMGAQGRPSAARRLERSAGQLEPARSEVPGARRRGAQRSSCRTRSSATRTFRRRCRRRRRWPARSC